jgi:peroxiredoxin
MAVLRALGTTALVVGGGGVGTGLIRSMALPFPVLVDADRATYRAYGLTRALHLLQESATLLVDRAGVVRHATYAHNPNASMQWERLLADVRAVAREWEAGGGVGA